MKRVRESRPTNRIKHKTDWLSRAMDAFLAKTEEKDSLPYEIVVFSCGTFVRLDCPDHERFPSSGFRDAEIEQFMADDFPHHRLPPDEENAYDRFMDENQQDWEWCQSLDSDVAEMCARGYGHLMRSGYPLPGGVGGDRITVPYVDGLFITTFPFLGMCCGTWTILEEGEEYTNASVDADGAARRRFDFMMPAPYAIIGRDKKITLLNEGKGSPEK